MYGDTERETDLETAGRQEPDCGCEAGERGRTDSSTGDDAGVECTIDDTDQDPGERARQVREELVPRFEGASELEDGYRLGFEAADGTLTALAEFVEQEAVCCGFAEYEISVEPPYGSATLALRGPEGTKEVFAGLVEALEHPGCVELHGAVE